MPADLRIDFLPFVAIFLLAIVVALASHVPGGLGVLELVLVTMLLVSGSVPAAEGRMRLLRDALPLPVVELSHFFGSVVGASLVLLARGLQRRIDTAWVLTIAMLAFGAIVSLAKGFDYEEAIILTLLAVALLSCRDQFYRRGRLLESTQSFSWIVLIIVSLAPLLWVLLFSYRHIEYSNDLWWNFAYQGDAPRSLRAIIGAAVVFLLVGIGNLLRPHLSPPEILASDKLDEVASIVKTSEQGSDNLALLGCSTIMHSAAS